jgi:hypothetical protein
LPPLWYSRLALARKASPALLVPLALPAPLVPLALLPNQFQLQT